MQKLNQRVERKDCCVGVHVWYVCVFLQREMQNEDQTKCVCCVKAELQAVWDISQAAFEILETRVFLWDSN